MQVALNILNVGAEDVLLDACCGTGTILVGGYEDLS
jgi:ubiquinone/menaquinone biosynthesis C-methylase UbiE